MRSMSNTKLPKKKKKICSHSATWEAFFVAVDSIWSHKLRSALTLLGMIIGVASVVAVGGAIEGFGGVYVRKLCHRFSEATPSFWVRSCRADSYDEYEIKIKRNKAYLSRRLARGYGQMRGLRGDFSQPETY